VSKYFYFNIPIYLRVAEDAILQEKNRSSQALRNERHHTSRMSSRQKKKQEVERATMSKCIKTLKKEFEKERKKSMQEMEKVVGKLAREASMRQ